MKPRYVTLDAAGRARFRTAVVALEATASYPLGDDRFRIDHGPDYFAFFDRLGELRYEVVAHGDEVVAVGAGVLREAPIRGAPKPAWYLCDLKVHPAHRGRRIPFSLASRAIPSGYVRCPRGYAISMNPGDGRDNPVVRLLERWRLVPVSLACTLHLYSLDADAMGRWAPRLLEHTGTPPRYLSLAGVKDIVLESTGAPMPLWHVQTGPAADPSARPTPVEGAVHMFCAPAGSALDAELDAAGVTPSGTASVIHHGMADCDWDFVLTSDI